MDDKNLNQNLEEELQTEPNPPEEAVETAPEEQAVPEAANEKKSSWREKKKKEDPKDEALKKLQDDYNTINDKYMRLLAEYDNFRKRSQRERDAIYPEATAAAVSSILGVIDNFERALAATCNDPEYKKGTELTYKSLIDALAKLNVEAFGVPGDAFDPNSHNAVMHVEDETVDTATVVEVFQKGYRLGERVIRHAMVKVAN